MLMRFSKLLRRRILAFMVLAFFLLSPVASWACTSMIVGKNASTTGRALFARTEDSQPHQSKKFVVIPAGFYKGGVPYALNSNGFTFTFTHDSYKYTAVPHTTRQAISAIGGEAFSKDYGVSNPASATYGRGLTPGPLFEDGYPHTFDACGVNEKGFAVSATTTTGIRSGIGMTTGTSLWNEHTMAKILLAEAANCKEAIDVVEKILETGQGMANEIIHMADQNEAWLLEAIGRHHFVASRVPDDCFAVLANAMHHQFYDEKDPANFRSNLKPDPNTYAIENGFARYQLDENGVKRVNISLTYGPTGGAGVNGEANTYRRWRGMSMFAPSLGLNVLDEKDYYGGGGTNATSSDIGKTYPTYIKPDRKISPMDIAWKQRDRYAGMPFDQTYSPQYLDANGGEIREGTANPNTVVSIRPPQGGGVPSITPSPANYVAIRTIGYYTQMHTHIFDTGNSLPPDIGSRFWIGMAASETSVNLPFYGNITDTHPKHKFDITAVNTATTGDGLNFQHPYNPDSAYSIFTRIGYLARGDRSNYVAPIKAFWRNYELKLYEDQERVIEPEVLRLHKEVSPEASAKFATDYSIAVADRAFRTAIRIHDALVAHIAAAPNTLFAIPAELLEPTINETALINPTDEDKKAVAEVLGGGYSLLTRDDGNIQVNPVLASNAPHFDGYKYNLPGAEVNITLKPEQIVAKQMAAKLLYEVTLGNDLVEQYGGHLDKLKNNIAFSMTLGGRPLMLVGPDSDALISFSEALAKGIATLTLTSDGAIVSLEYILVDESGNSGFYNDRLVVFDGNANAILRGSIWLATPTTIPSHKDDDKDDCKDKDHGCDAGLGYAALGLFGILMFVRKRIK